jgi:hypothetical protein
MNRIDPLETTSAPEHLTEAAMKLAILLTVETATQPEQELETTSEA